jgi:hypothetical protein
MNVARKMVVFAVGCFASIGAAQAQYIDCTLPTSTKLACIVPYGTGAYKANSNTEASIFSGPISTQLSQLPLAASAPGAVILTIHGNPEAYDNLGPVLVDRPDSVGQGRLVLGFSAQQFNFNHLDGVGIGSIPLVFQASTTATPTTPSVPLPDYFSQTIHASVKINQYVMLATYGFPKKTDVSVIVPYSRISIGVAGINATQYSVAEGSATAGTPSTAYTSGFARGVGDVVVNAKHVLWSGGEVGRGSVAAGVAVRLPTGDALNYLGSGAYGFNLYGLAAYKAKFSPHAKIAYQWNTNSVLLNLAGTGPNQSLPGGFQAAAGADFGASSHLTLSADMLVTEFQNSPSIYAEKYGIVNPNAPATLVVMPTVVTINRTYTTANFSGGLKWKPFLRKDLVLYGNVLIQVNEVGLRSDPSPSGGISYNFGGLNKWPNWLYRKPGHW